MTPPTMSDFAWVALDQLRRKTAVWDGDLVSKSGRTELIKLGLAERFYGLNSLTDAGRQLAQSMSFENWQTGKGRQ